MAICCPARRIAPPQFHNLSSTTPPLQVAGESEKECEGRLGKGCASTIIPCCPPVSLMSSHILITVYSQGTPTAAELGSRQRNLSRQGPLRRGFWNLDGTMHAHQPLRDVSPRRSASSHASDSMTT